MLVNPNDFSMRFPFIGNRTEPDELRSFMSALAMRQVPEGTILIHDGDHSASLYLVWDGGLEAYIENNDEKVTLGKISPGEWFGEVSVLDPGPATATVRAESDATLLILSAESFHALDQSFPDITSKILQMLSEFLIDRLLEADELLLKNSQAEETSMADEKDSGVRNWAVSIYRKVFGREKSTS